MSFVSFIKCDQCGKTESFERHSGLTASSLPPGWKGISTNAFSGPFNVCSWKCLRQYADEGIDTIPAKDLLKKA